MTDKPRKKMLVATGNRGKFLEIVEILKELEDKYELVSLEDMGIENDYVEEGSTHEEIALGKARYFAKKSGGMMTLADDSGIIVDALKTELGVRTRRWGAGEKASDEKWLEYFLMVMKDVPDERRTARFVCCACILDENKGAHLFVGQTDGIILRKTEAPIRHGLPLSSVFKPKGYDQVFSALPEEKKNEISHRGKAVKAVKEFLRKWE